MYKKLVLTCLTSSLFVGCSSTPKNIAVIDRNGLDVLATSAGLQPWVVKEPTSKEQLCLAPPPDAVIDQSSSVNLPTPGTAITGGPGISIGAQSNDLNLGGRSPSVLIVREYLYRLCELSLNLNLDKETRLQLWQEASSIVKSSIGSSLSSDASASVSSVSSGTNQTSKNTSNIAPPVNTKPNSQSNPTQILVF